MLKTNKHKSIAYEQRIFNVCLSEIDHYLDVQRVAAYLFVVVRLGAQTI